MKIEITVKERANSFVQIKASTTIEGIKCESGDIVSKEKIFKTMTSRYAFMQIVDRVFCDVLIQATNKLGVERCIERIPVSGKSEVTLTSNFCEVKG